MLPCHPTDPDYAKRFEVLEKAGVLQKPDRKAGTPLRILKRDVLDELSFSFFVGWLLNGVLNDKVRISFVPLGPTDDTTLMVAYARDGGLATPRRSLSVVDVDDTYFECPLDRAGGAAISKNAQVLCPVLNKLRYNLGEGPAAATYQIPKKSEECCASKKTELWNYLRATVVPDADTYGRVLGGTSFPLKLPPSLLGLYATGLLPERTDFGKVFDETLLWYAMDASGCGMGLPHVEILAPFKSNEIDFVLYDTAGKQQQRVDAEPSEGWRTFVADQSLCVFETTVGHRKEAGDDGSVVPGSDHPKNKLMNFLALKRAGFKKVDFHYVNLTGFGKIADATREALQGTDGFNYWSLTSKFHDLEEAVMGHFDAPVPIAKFREWHAAVVSRVEEVARAFAA